MTTGLLLKNELGLTDFQYVRISRAVVSSYRVLLVYYDSYRKTMPVTNQRIKSFPWVSTILHGTDLFHGSDKAPIITPPMPIEDYNGLIRGGLIIPINLAGDRFINKDQFTKVFESVDKTEPKPIIQFNETLLEFVTLADLSDTGNISNFTNTWRKDRNRTMGAENITAKLIDCFVNEADKSVTFGFLTECTELKGKPANDNLGSYGNYDGEKGEVDPDTFVIKSNRSKTYEIQGKILEFFDWLSVFEGEVIGEQEMKDILRVSNVQVFSTSPSFHWQGMNYNLSQLDGSIYPTDIPNDTWGSKHGDPSGYFLDKHLYGLLRQMPFFVNPMASMLTKRLKDRGLI